MKNKREQLKKIKNERGLTLVELLAVIVILGIISTIAFVSINGVIDNSKKDAQIANAQQIIDAAKLYEVTEGDFKSEDGSIKFSTLKESGLLEEIIDPWTKEVNPNAEDAKVTKDDGKYSITLDDAKSKHTITDASEAKLREGRDEVY